jgi:hypothetical protein
MDSRDLVVFGINLLEVDEKVGVTIEASMPLSVQAASA